MAFKLTHPNRVRAGFTLVELMIATALGVLVVGSAVSFFIFSLRSFAAMANYSDLNRKDRNTKDLISRDIRRATSLVSATTNQLVLGSLSGNITYSFDAAAGRLTRADSLGTNILLTAIDSFAFALYRRPATNAAYNTFLSATTANAKLVAFQWTCSRRLDRAQLETESVQMGLVNLRNQ